MSFFGFIFGAMIMAVGFMAVWKTDWFVRNMGDFGSAFGLSNSMWMSWKFFGMVAILIGFLIAFGLFQVFFTLTIGQLFTTSY